MGQETPQAPSQPGGPARTGQAHAHALAFLIIVIISTSFPLGERITHGLDPAVMMCIRFVLAALLMAPVVAWREGLALPPAGACARYLALGAPLAFFFWCMFEALRYTSGLNESALFTIVPGLSALFGAVLVGERLGLHRLAALVLGMIGALWIIFRGDPARLQSRGQHRRRDLPRRLSRLRHLRLAHQAPAPGRADPGADLLDAGGGGALAAGGEQRQALAYRLVGGRGGGAGRHRLPRGPADPRQLLPHPVHNAPHRPDAGAGLRLRAAGDRAPARPRARASPRRR